MSIPLNAFDASYAAYEGLRLIVAVGVVGFCLWTLVFLRPSLLEPHDE